MSSLIDQKPLQSPIDVTAENIMTEVIEASSEQAVIGHARAAGGEFGKGIQGSASGFMQMAQSGKQAYDKKQQSKKAPKNPGS